MLRKLCWLFFVGFSLAVAKEQEPSLPLSDTEGEMSSIVNGCVNTITGNLLEWEADLVIPGPEPIIFPDTTMAQISVQVRFGTLGAILCIQV